MSNTERDTQKNIRRTALILTAIAVAFYLGFILMGVLRS